MISFIKRFIKGEDGAELVQWAIIIAICVALAVIAYQISQSAAEKLNEAKEQIDDLNVSGGSTS